MPELIALQTRVPQFETPLESQGKALQLRQMLNSGQVADMELQQRRQAVADDQAARAAFSANPTDSAARLSALAGVSPAAYGAEAKRQADLAKAGADTEKTKLETAKQRINIMGNAMGFVRDNPTPENALRVISDLQQHGIFTPEQAAQYASQVQANPNAIRELAQQGYQSALEVKDQLMKYETRDAGGTVQTLGIAPATGGVRVVKTIQKSQSPDSVAANARMASEGAANRANALKIEGMKAERQQAQGPVQIIQTDNGPMLVSKATGEARPVTADGTALAARAKEVPAAVKKSMFENDAALRKINDAMQAIDAYPEALGGMNILGDTIRQRTDPQGVKVRALVSDIGSLKMHDRSGAAVTAAETPRLKPFIPSATDSPETVKEKLSLFQREYQALQDDMSAAYPAAASTRQASAAPSAKKPSTPKSPAANTNAKGWVLHTDAAGNRAYVSPDGKQFEEVK